MNIRQFAATILLLGSTSMAIAHSEHGKAQYGGVFAEAGSFQAELVVKPELITMYLSDHEKTLSSAGTGAKLTVLSGSTKTEVTLKPAGSNKLEARGSFKLGAGSKVVASVTLPGKPAQNLRFVLP